jgi:D-tagatose-1,6-bisphosphate aldolase subunit GatZ/KbaZ
MSVLDGIVARNRAGQGIGLPSYCTAHPETLAAILRSYRDNDAPVLIEATCNQVNQSGGYTGMTPGAFRRFVEEIAKAQGVAPGRLILGGDHLGPNPWKAERAEVAMDRAREMVAAYVQAGFSKIHLDASMACADDGMLAEEVMADRAADLAAVAEAAGAGPLR